jgi:hypothetical protein
MTATAIFVLTSRFFCHRGPSIDASDQVSAHLTKWFQKWLFRNRPMRNNNYMWRLCLLTDRDEMNTLHRRSSWNVLDKHCSVHTDQLINMTATAIFVLTSRFFHVCNRNKVGSVYGRPSMQSITNTNVQMLKYLEPFL